jgi:hypothetical protein
MGSFTGGRHKNQKTEYSIDFTTLCPRVRAGHPCSYCYVETSRRNGDLLAKTVIDYTPYDGFVKRMRSDTIRRLNRVGGIRLFSFSDYMPSHRKDIQAFLDDSAKAGLFVKAITKQLEFVDLFHDHPAMRLVHISIDNLAQGGSPITFAKARAYRKRYPKVMIRAVVLDHEDLELFGSYDWVDILTLNHGGNGFRPFRNAEKKRIAKQYPGRVCCATGVCKTCRVRCGIGRRKSA